MTERHRLPPSSIDRAIGHRIRERRIALGMTQYQVGEAIGCWYQQVHRLETGQTSFTITRMFALAKALKTSVPTLLKGLETSKKPTPRQRACIEMHGHFSKIGNERHQDALLQMARALGDGDVS